MAELVIRMVGQLAYIPRRPETLGNPHLRDRTGFHRILWIKLDGFGKRTKYLRTACGLELQTYVVDAPPVFDMCQQCEDARPAVTVPSTEPTEEDECHEPQTP